jgi:thioredoxin reductase
MSHHQILIVGGAADGLTAASQLKRARPALEVVIPYELLHVTPPMAAPDVVATPPTGSHPMPPLERAHYRAHRLATVTVPAATHS